MSESIIISLIGVAGAIIGSIATLAAQWLSHYLKQCTALKRDEPRKKLLLIMLKSKGHTWRKFETLMNVIGADESTTKRLLLEVGARASEDGRALWSLITRNPLPNDDT